MSLVIGICTRQRNAELLRLLNSLSTQSLPQGWTAQIVIVDNNDAPQVKDLIDGLSLFCHLAIHHEPRAGLVNARNRALDAAEDMAADWFIGLDDDEWVAADWLAKYCAALTDGSGQQIRMGPCQLVYAADASQFLTKHPPAYVEAGKPPRALTTQNFAIHKSVFHTGKGAGLRFHMAFNETGGEDSEFFRRAIRQYGFVVGSVPDAKVFEDRKDGRATLRYRLSRTLRNQISMLRVNQLHQRDGIHGSQRGNAKRIVKLVVRNTIKCFAGLLLGFMHLISDREKGMTTIGSALQHGARVVAVVRFLLGMVPIAYGKTQDPT